MNALSCSGIIVPEQPWITRGRPIGLTWSVVVIIVVLIPSNSALKDAGANLPLLLVMPTSER